MRTLLLIVGLNLSLAAAVPTDALKWNGTYTSTSAASRLRKVQAYAFIDYQANPDMWFGVAHDYRKVLPMNDHRFLTGVVFSNGIRGASEEEADEPILRTEENTLLRAFAGDASGAFVEIGPDGRIKRIDRMDQKSPGDTLYKIVAESADVTPLFVESHYPGGAAPVLRAARAGDFRVMVANVKRARDGAQVMADLPKRLSLLVAEELAVLEQADANPAARMFAAERLQAVLQEFPQLPDAKAIAAAIKAVRGNERIQTERRAWTALEGYFAAARKAPVKKLEQVMKTQLAAIRAQHPDTHAAEVAAMIQAAARIE